MRREHGLLDAHPEDPGAIRLRLPSTSESTQTVIAQSWSTVVHQAWDLRSWSIWRSRSRERHLGHLSHARNNPIVDHLIVIHDAAGLIDFVELAGRGAVLNRGVAVTLLGHPD